MKPVDVSPLRRFTHPRFCRLAPAHGRSYWMQGDRSVGVRECSKILVPPLASMEQDRRLRGNKLSRFDFAHLDPEFNRRVNVLSSSLVNGLAQVCLISTTKYFYCRSLDGATKAHHAFCTGIL